MIPVRNLYSTNVNAPPLRKVHSPCFFANYFAQPTAAAPPAIYLQTLSYVFKVQKPFAGRRETTMNTSNGGVVSVVQLLACARLLNPLMSVNRGLLVI